MATTAGDVRKLKSLSRTMRKESTAAERKLWKRIPRKHVHGVKFRRQPIIDQYIVDFCSPSIRLIIEVDGPTHENTREADRFRQSILETYGFEVVRFSNRDVLSNIDGVLMTIYDLVEKKKTPP
jgi:5-methyltetrahydrofolate--homocysteine methyltransferase